MEHEEDDFKLTVKQQLFCEFLSADKKKMLLKLPERLDTAKKLLGQ